jgi:hypothetical protein
VISDVQRSTYINKRVEVKKDEKSIDKSEKSIDKRKEIVYTID